jgi:uroporphyrinogen decarboxylase
VTDELRSDRFLRACRRQAADVTPVWFMRQAGRALPEYREIRKRATLFDITRDAALCAEVTLQPVQRLGVDAAILFADITTPLPGAGVAVEIVDGVGPVIADPVRTAVDVGRIGRFDRDSVAGLLDAIRLIRGSSPVPLIGFAGAPFTLASYLVEGRAARDAPTLRALLHADPVLADELLGRLTDLAIDYLAAQVEAGVQAVQLFDSWVGLLSPADYRRFVAPQMRRLFRAVAGLGVPAIHFGTDTAGLLPDMAAAGGDVIGLDWRIGLADGWSRVGEDRAVQGNLDPWLLLGPWEGVARAARGILAEAAGRPGHVFNLGHGVLPATDPEHLRRLVDLVHETTDRRVVRAAVAGAAS